ncbi:MAG: MFS transporter [Planctomycetaceae bacterium]|nr:MFS transporter [Planctomycetaceae bacterium]
MKTTAATLYAISAITVLAGAAIAPALGSIAQNFPGVNPILIQMLITLPSIMVIPCTMWSNSICRKYGKKPVLVAGLLCYCIGGCGGGLADSIWTLLAMRALLGIGMGTITPVCHSLPADFFQGDRKVTVIGRMSAFITIGAAVCSVGAGWLAVLSWRASFGIYAVSLLVLLMVIVFLPSPKRADAPAALTAEPVRLPRTVYLLGLTMLVYMAAFYAFPLGLSMHLESAGIGDSRTAGYLFALISVIAFAIGMVFPKFMAFFGRRLLAFLLLCMGGGYLIVAFAGTAVMVWFGCCLVGIGLGGLTPLHYVLVNRAVGKEATVKAVSVLVAGTFAGQFASPFLLLLIKTIPAAHLNLGLYGSIGSVMTAIGLGLIPVLLLTRAAPAPATATVSSRTSARISARR